MNVDQAFPLELKVPNAQTRRAMAESEGMMRQGKARFASADEMFAELEEARPPVNEHARLAGRTIPRDFLKDWERLSRSGRYDIHRLKAVMLLLIANDAPLGPERRDHALKGAWANHREYHGRRGLSSDLSGR